MGDKIDRGDDKDRRRLAWEGVTGTGIGDNEEDRKSERGERVRERGEEEGGEWCFWVRLKIG